jgi:hypothetical protein
MEKREISVEDVVLQWLDLKTKRPHEIAEEWRSLGKRKARK